MKNILFVVLFFSFSTSAQKITTIEGNGKKLTVADMTFMDRITWGGYEQIGNAAQSETDGPANTKVEPRQVGFDAVLVFLGRALRIGVVDAQHEPAALGAGEQPVDQAGANVADMQPPGGRRRETDPDGHGRQSFSEPG